MMSCSQGWICPEMVREFFAAPFCLRILKIFNVEPGLADEILKNDFNCGYIAAIETVVFLLLLFLIVRIVFWLCFRTRRCGSVVVPSAGGDLIVTRNAIESVVRGEVESFPQIYLRKLLLYERGSVYCMKLFCRFERGQEGMPEIAQNIRQRLTEVMARQFGIDSIKDISICIERLKEETEGDDTSCTPPDYPHVISGF